MRHLCLLIAGCLFGLNAFATVPAVFKLTNRSVQIFNYRSIFSSGNSDEQLLALDDPKIDSSELILNYSSFQRASKNVAGKDFRKKFEENIKQYEKTYSPQLQQYIEAIAQKHNPKVHKDGSVKLYSIQDGVKFFQDLYSFKGVNDPMLKAMILSFLHNSFREKLIGPLEKIIFSMTARVTGHTFLLSPGEYSDSDLKSLTEIAKENNYRYELVGNTWILGSGFSFLNARDIIKKGNSLSNPTLKAKFEKIVRYHKNFLIPVTHEYKQGAAAYFDPSSEKMTFVLPSRSDLNSYTHEMTHSRFHNFTKTLDAWTAAKGYQVPYQINGPSLDGIGALFATHGGLFNLLNEVNSWRIGESFDGKGADAQILKTLTEKYGQQAGYESAELLEKVWTPAKLAGKTIPYLIYNEIREFNKMTNDQLVMMGFEGVEEKSLLKKVNFLIMYHADRFKGAISEGDANFVLEEIAKSSTEKPVLEHLSMIDGRFKSQDESEKESKDLSSATFEEVLEDFRKTGSRDARDLLKEKFLKQIGPEHMGAIVERAGQAKTGLLNHEGVEVLEAVLNNAKITPPVTKENDSVKIRAPRKSPILDALDTSLSARLYDGGIAGKKMDLLNFISGSLHPKELPRTYEKTLDILKNVNNRPNSDVWLARLFFMPSADYVQNPEILWGEKLIQDLKGTEVAQVVREAMGFFYKDSLTSFLSEESYGIYSSSNMKEKTRVKVVRELNKLTPKQQASLETASRQLWTLAGDVDPQVRTSALYAILSNPMYLIKNEGRMMQALLNKDSKYFSAASFLLDVGPEMAPEAKRIYDIQKEKEAKSMNSCNKVFLGL